MEGPGIGFRRERSENGPVIGATSLHSCDYLIWIYFILFDKIRESRFFLLFEINHIYMAYYFDPNFKLFVFLRIA